jgi:hypothetical protein
VTPETLHDALSLGMAVRQHWQRVRRQAGSDHDLGYVGFEADRIVVSDRGGRQYLLTFRPSQRPPDPAVSTDYCPWVIDNDPRKARSAAGPSCALPLAPAPPSKACALLDTGSCGAAARPATVPAGGLRSLLARTCLASSRDPEVQRSILPQDLGVMGVPVVRPLPCQEKTSGCGAAGTQHFPK